MSTDKLAAAEETQWRNIEAQTGKSRATWITLANRQGFEKHGALMAWLKTEMGLTHGNANLVAIRAREAAAGAPPAGGDLLAAQYAGAKAGLKPIYDAVHAAVLALGPELEFAPKKAYMSLRRKKQFALIQPTTATRLDLGLVLKGAAPQGRLEASASFSAMCTHRVRLESVAQVDTELKRWLTQAFDEAG